MVMEQNKQLLRTKFYIPPIRSKQIARPRLSDLIIPVWIGRSSWFPPQPVMEKPP